MQRLLFIKSDDGSQMLVAVNEKHFHKEKRLTIIAMKGHPCTGKSTLARSLARVLKCSLFFHNDVRDCIEILEHECHMNILFRRLVSVITVKLITKISMNVQSVSLNHTLEVLSCHLFFTTLAISTHSTLG